ncbi:hypothetical protein [Gimesia aquarii]|uniref:Uncharacterized protein n=1 Tax=Gimesia aquarii TaxID=2527964 RepID=A0A517WNM5_9PLAN|nr:hypothetical protein [Gimesia aquarii]QDU06845.1 hypothetical protein V202x_01880 [Gimesia aquarii]
MIHFVSCELLRIEGDDAFLEIKYRVDAGQEVYQYQVKQNFSVEDGCVYIGPPEVLNGNRPGWAEYASDHELIGDTLQDDYDEKSGMFS